MAHGLPDYGDGGPPDRVTDVEPWERQPMESQVGWEAFRVYRDLDPPRYMRRVKEHFDAIGRVRTMDAYRRLSHRWRWRERVAAYDLHMDRVRQKAREDEVRAMEQRHARIAMAGLTKVAQRLLGNPEHGIEPVDMNSVDFSQLANAASAFARLERVSMGQAADRTVQEHSGPSGAPIEVALHHDLAQDPHREAERVASILQVLAEEGVIMLPEGSGERVDVIDAEEAEVEAEEVPDDG